MNKFGTIAFVLCFLHASADIMLSQSEPARVVQATLTEAGGTPFYLQAVITERQDPDERVEIEIFWLAPNKWRRTIKSRDFSQTLIVNDSKIYEQDSDDYLPLGIQVLATAMVDPKPILGALRPGDRVMTKANGAADESGKICFSPNSKMCLKGRYGLSESLGAPGRAVDFTDYHEFKGKRVARLLTYHIDPGDSLQARVTALGEFDSHDEGQFSIAASTPRGRQIRSVLVPEAELRNRALEPLEIIWPQVLEDNDTKGDTSYYLSLDRSGTVREVFPLSVSVERANNSARRQIIKWKFKPVLEDGAPAQAEAILNFHFDTRAYGPPVPLTDAEVRKLASNVIEPVFPAGAAPP